jgi:hypothetical protein
MDRRDEPSRQIQELQMLLVPWSMMFVNELWGYDSLHVERSVKSLIHDNSGSNAAGLINDVVLKVAGVVLAFCLKPIDCPWHSF